MADWKDQYLAALHARDEVEKSNIEIYKHYTRLADQKAELEKKAAIISTTRASTGDENDQIGPQSPALLGRGLRRVTSPPVRPETPSLTQMRLDLSKAQHERSELQANLELAKQELEKLKVKSKLDSRRITQLTGHVTQLTTKLRDRDEELRGKAKLVEQVQDENVTLNLQLNVSEDRSQKLKQENQELVDRWMVRMGKEAERMNDESKFG